MIVSEGQAPRSSDYNFNTEHLIPSLTHRMNITSNAGDYFYIGSEEGGGYVYLYVHNATFDLSIGIKHATNLLPMMSTNIGTNESSYKFYFVGLDIDGVSNHNHKHARNQITLFSLFILGNMDKLNVRHERPGLSFLNTAEITMDFLNIGLSGIVLKSNVQVGNGLFMDEVVVK